MLSLIWSILWFGGLVTLAYHKTIISVTSLALIAGFFLTLLFSPFSTLSLFILFIFISSILLFLHFPKERQERITRPLLLWFQKRLPKMSETESVALQAGTVGFDGELFSGNPNWSHWWKMKAPSLTAEEQAFLAGPVETLCRMLNDWEISHVQKDLSQEVWEFLKKEGFFGIIIPKKYGGLQFSAVAHSEILSKIGSCSLTAASTVAVPNSLGPAELIHRYGTEEQKNTYLSKLAKGSEIPCFALTHLDAGSDAASIPDHGVVCRDLFEGNEILGIRLNWEKRFITLAPIATLLGLAFKLYDPDHLISEQTELGITCALVPTHLPGIIMGSRHKPLCTPFQNGPTVGKNVFIPLDWIIGGPKMAGQGWRMLVECLSTGRAISLPSSVSGAAKMLAAATTAYARIRRQFKQPIGRFGGIEEVLARIASNTFIIDSLRLTTAACIDQKESPAVLGAIAKCYATERYRTITSDVMDVHGGKGIMMGPKNYTANSYMGSPISITVEGANILTRSMIIFGQGVMRSHPYILQEIQAAQIKDPTQALLAFDTALMSHLAYSVSNAARALVFGLSDINPWSKRHCYTTKVTRASSAFAVVADICMLVLGGKLKFKEKLSGRFSDMLAMMYICAAVLKRHHDHGQPVEDKPLIEWAVQDSLNYFWHQMDELLANFPNRILGRILRVIVMPLGKQSPKPSDKLTHELVSLLLSPTQTRERLIQGIYLDFDINKPHCQIERVFKQIVIAEEAADGNEVKNETKKQMIEEAEKSRKEILGVDHFSVAEF